MPFAEFFWGRRVAIRRCVFAVGVDLIGFIDFDQNGNSISKWFWRTNSSLIPALTTTTSRAAIDKSANVTITIRIAEVTAVLRRRRSRNAQQHCDDCSDEQDGECDWLDDRKIWRTTSKFSKTNKSRGNLTWHQCCYSTLYLQNKPSTELGHDEAERSWAFMNDVGLILL